MTEEIFEQVAAPLIAEQDKLITAYNTAMADRKSLGDYEGAAKNIEAHTQAEKNVKLVDAHIAEYEKDIERLRKEMPDETTVAINKPDTSALDAKLADLDTRILRGNQALTAVVQADTNRQHYDAQTEAKKKLDRKQALLEKLVDYFGPKGIQARLLDEHVGGFESSMNKVLKGWGYRCHLQFDPFVFGVSFDGKEQVYNLQTISASQRAMFSIAFQVALAKVSGLNFVVVDAADIFLDANRSALYRTLVGAGLDQVIVMQSDLRREVPKIPNAVFYLFTLDKAYGEVPRTVVERL
jgi:DNA repair exonuclease SbcCD ATPase subunit